MFRKFTSERVRKARRKRTIFMSVLYVLLVVFVFIDVWQLSYTPLLRIDRIVVSGTKAIPRQEVFSLAQARITGADWIFSKRNVFLYSRNGIARDVIAAYPRAKRVEVHTTGLHEIDVVVTEREIKALVCKKTDATCYFADGESYIFAEAPDFLGNAYVRYSARLVENPIGKRLMSPNDFSALSTFVSSLVSLSFFVKDVEVTKDDLSITARTISHDVKILVSRTTPYEDTLTNLRSILRDDAFSLQTVSQIDLRFGNKIFYKEGAVDEAPAPTIHSSSELRPL